jgi:hypothetical protein
MSNVAPLFHLNIILKHNPLSMLIRSSHCGSSLKKFHRGKNWSLVFAAVHNSHFHFHTIVEG